MTKQNFQPVVRKCYNNGNIIYNINILYNKNFTMNDEVFNIFNQDYLLVAPPGSEEHCRLESFINRTIQKRKTLPA